MNEGVAWVASYYYCYCYYWNANCPEEKNVTFLLLNIPNRSKQWFKRRTGLEQIYFCNFLLYVFTDSESSRCFGDTLLELFKKYFITLERNTSKTCYNMLLNSHKVSNYCASEFKTKQIPFNLELHLWIPMYHPKWNGFSINLMSYCESSLSRWRSYFLNENLDQRAQFITHKLKTQN